MRPHPQLTLSMGNKKMALRKGGAEEEEGWRDWSSLTEALLQCIISLFTTLQDFFAFRSVCCSWRSAAILIPQTMSSQSPLILFYRRTGFFKTPTRMLFDMARSRYYLILPPYGDIFGYSHGHLIINVMKSSKSSYVELIDLFTGTLTLRLPTRQSILKPYRFRLSSSPSTPGCLAIYQPRKYEAFHYCYITDPMQMEWKQWAKEDVEDILFFNNRLYVLTKSMELWVLDPLSNPWDLVLLEATSPVPVLAKSWRYSKYLAESGGELLMVCRGNRCGSERCLFWRWNFEGGGGWVAVSCLGRRSLFIDLTGFVGLVSMPKICGLRQNCIYFLGKNWPWYCSSYSLGEGRFRTVTWASPYLNEKVDSPLWILPNVI